MEERTPLITRERERGRVREQMTEIKQRETKQVREARCVRTREEFKRCSSFGFLVSFFKHLP
jgi:hypothetical protein